MCKLLGNLLCRLFGHPFHEVIQRPMHFDNGYGHLHKGKRPYCQRCQKDIGGHTDIQFSWIPETQKKVKHV